MPRLHTVRAGETPMSIARQYTGDPRRLPELLDANTHKPTVIAGDGVTFESLEEGEQVAVPEAWQDNPNAPRPHPVASKNYGVGAPPQRNQNPMNPLSPLQPPARAPINVEQPLNPQAPASCAPQAQQVLQLQQSTAQQQQSLSAIQAQNAQLQSQITTLSRQIQELQYAVAQGSGTVGGAGVGDTPCAVVEAQVAQLTALAQTLQGQIDPAQELNSALRATVNTLTVIAEELTQQIGSNPAPPPTEAGWR